MNTWFPHRRRNRAVHPLALLALLAGLAAPAGPALGSGGPVTDQARAAARMVPRPPDAELAGAVSAADDARIRELVAAGADPNAVDARGAPLLQRAMRGEDRKVYRLLIELGADPRRGDRDGRTALHLAAMGKSSFWLEDLLDRGLSPDLPNTLTQAPPLFDALRAGLPGNVDRLLAAGARLDVHDRNGTTPLHQAALVKDTAWVLKFLEAGADADVVDRHGARFRDYLYDGDRSVLNVAARRRLEKIDAWLAAHDARRAGGDTRSGQPVFEGDFRIGPTGIHCVRPPCPWRGIVSLDAEGPRARWPVWSGEGLPPVLGSDADRDRIAGAWRERACLIVEGRFAEGVLAVQRIKGEC